jgi:hypothetical protein
MATAVAMCAMQSSPSSVVVGAHSMSTPPQGAASTTPVSVAGPFRTQQLQSTFHGTSLLESSIQAGRSSVAIAPLKTFRLLPAVRAKTAGASRTYETEVDKPLGLTLGQNPGGRVVITVQKQTIFTCVFLCRKIIQHYCNAQTWVQVLLAD